MKTTSIFYRLVQFTLISFLSLQVASAQWSTVGTAGFSAGIAFQNTISFDKNGDLYVAFSDAGVGQRVTVKKLVSGVWTTLGAAGFAGGQGNQSCSMALSSTNVPYVAVISSVDLQASVWKLTAGTWEKVGADVSEEMAGGVEIALNSADVPYVLYRDQKSINAISGRATVKKFNGLSWELVGTEGFSDNFIQSLDIAIDKNDVPYVAYEDGGHGLQATVQKFNGASWELVGPVGFTGSWAKFISLAIDQDNVPYLGFQDFGAFSRASCMKFNGTAWIYVGTSTGISPSQATYISLTIDKNKIPLIAYKSESSPFSATVKKFNGTSWVAISTENFTGNTAGFLSLTTDKFANPFVAFQDANNGFRETVATFQIFDPLPVNLIAFEGKYSKTEQAIMLEWSTAEETSNDRFEIEAGNTPGTLKKTAEVIGKGNNRGIAYYSFTDNISKGSITYYRLKQVDWDGTFSYSRIISVSRPGSGGVYITENPVRDNLLRIHTGGKSAEEVDVSLFSMNGKKMSQWTFNKEEELRMNVNGLLPGMYLLKYADKSGVQSRKFMKE
ncbi:MAG: T9SS type A sorting domain-containing protein [Dyadobacter sp.]|uniref:T9SS type A sorting domain-containing protein n=1 Tax=Dyadobacter sp. TaxID=1914288 RepID=UPI003264F3E6